jgi:hypothetical protein
MVSTRTQQVIINYTDYVGVVTFVFGVQHTEIYIYRLSIQDFQVHGFLAKKTSQST